MTRVQQHSQNNNRGALRPPVKGATDVPRTLTDQLAALKPKAHVSDEPPVTPVLPLRLFGEKSKPPSSGESCTDRVRTEPDRELWAAAKRDRIAVRITLLTGAVVEGFVTEYGLYSVAIDTSGQSGGQGAFLVFKNAISTATTMGARPRKRDL